MAVILKYPGSKGTKAHLLIKRFPVHYKIYCEAFGGSAAVLLRKETSKKEILNDLNKELMNFYQVVLTNYEEFREKVQYLPSHRELYSWLKNFETDDKILRAVKTYYRYTFGFVGGNYHTLRLNANNVSGFVPHKYEAFRKRMKNVQIMSDDAVELIKRIDRPEAFFYLDPPYFEVSKRLYDFMFELEDHIRLADCLKKIKGKFLLSYNDVPEIRELYEEWANVETLEFKYRMGNHGSTSGPLVNELIIDNYRSSQTSLDRFKDLLQGVEA